MTVDEEAFWRSLAKLSPEDQRKARIHLAVYGSATLRHEVDRITLIHPGDMMPDKEAKEAKS